MNLPKKHTTKCHCYFSQAAPTDGASSSMAQANITRNCLTLLSISSLPQSLVGSSVYDFTMVAFGRFILISRSFPPLPHTPFPLNTIFFHGDPQKFPAVQFCWIFVLFLRPSSSLKRIYYNNLQQALSPWAVVHHPPAANYVLYHHHPQIAGSTIHLPLEASH